jgi:hypothetical protein
MLERAFHPGRQGADLLLSGHPIELLISDVPQARRKLHPQEIEQGIDQVGTASSIRRRLDNRQLRGIVEDRLAA